MNNNDPLSEVPEVMNRILEEQAAESNIPQVIKQEEVLPSEFSDRDKMMLKTGQAQAFSLMEKFTGQLKARCIEDLDEKEAFKHFGYRSHKDFCIAIGVGERTGHSLKKWIRELTMETLQTMLRAGIRKKDINFITGHSEVKIEKEGNKTVIEIAGVKCDSTNKDAIETAIKNLQQQIEKEKKAREKAEQKNKEAQEKISELEMKLDIPTDQQELNNILDVHFVDLLRWVQKFKKIREKAAGNDDLENNFNSVIAKCSSLFTSEMPKLNF